MEVSLVSNKMLSRIAGNSQLDLLFQIAVNFFKVGSHLVFSNWATPLIKQPSLHHTCGYEYVKPKRPHNKRYANFFLFIFG